MEMEQEYEDHEVQIDEDIIQNKKYKGETNKNLRKNNGNQYR
jgi:hypothetical protein